MLLTQCRNDIIQNKKLYTSEYISTNDLYLIDDRVINKIICI